MIVERGIKKIKEEKMMKNKLLISVFLLVLMVFSLSVSANTVPHPLAEYRVLQYRAVEDALREKYSVTIESEDVVHPWREYSYATLYSRELAETWATRRAFLHSFSVEEKEDLLAEELFFLDEHIMFQLFLRSHSKEAYPFTHIVNFNPESLAFTPQVTRILLETDDGRIMEAKERYPGGSTARGGSWRVHNSVVFSAFDNQGEPLITEETEWVYLWLVTEDYRVYFPFHFQ